MDTYRGPLSAGHDEQPFAGVSDFPGRPVYRDTSRGWRSALFVSVVEIATNYANFGVSSNLITYLTGPLGHSNAAAVAAVNAWSGTASLMPLLGAFVADSWLGRYQSIVLACTLYILGYGMITLASTLSVLQLSLLDDKNLPPRHSSLKVAFFYASLYLIALAQGADMPCGLAFAADQFDPDHPHEMAARSSFYMKSHGEDEDNANKLEEARAVLGLLPIWVTCLAFGVVFAQVSTLFNKQGRTLDLRIFGGLKLPPAALRTFGLVSILVFVPIYDRVLVPALRCATGNPSGLTPLQRIGTGMTLSLAAVSVAALVESQRLETAREHGLVDDASAVVPMCGAWLVPQYVIIGMADVFAVVGMREFFYNEMADDLRSLGLAPFWGVLGISSFTSGALIALIDRVTKSGGGDSWFADNLNRAHLDYFYWLLAGVSAVEFVLYLHFASSYVYLRKRFH